MKTMLIEKLVPGMNVIDNLEVIKTIKAVDYLNNKVLFEGDGFEIWNDFDHRNAITITKEILTNHLGFTQMKNSELRYENSTSLVVEFYDMFNDGNFKIIAKIKEVCTDRIFFLATVNYVHELQAINNIIMYTPLKWIA